MPYLLAADGAQLVFILLYGLGIFVVLLIFYHLVRGAVRADQIIKNQEAIIWFLILQCKRLGATDDEMQKIKDHYGIGK